MRTIPNIGTFFTPQNLEYFWSMLAVLLKFVAPAVLIMLAIYLVGMLLNIIIKAVRKGTDDNDDRRNNDDDYEIRNY